MLDIQLFNSPTGLVDGTNPRPVINLPLTGSLDGGGLGAGSFKRASIAWHMNNVDTLIESAVDVERYTKNGLLLEAAGTNVCLQSRDLGTSPWTTDGSPTVAQDEVGLDGVANTAWTVTDSATDDHEGIQQVIAVPDDSNQHTFSVFIKKDTDVSRFPSMQCYFNGGGGRSIEGQLNTSTGAVAKRFSSNEVTDLVWSEDYGDWWRLCINLTNDTDGNTSGIVKVFPAITKVLGTADQTATGSIVADQVQLELNQSFASSPMVTGALGSDLVTNGDFAADSDWSKGTGWTIAAGVADCDGTQTGWTVLSQDNVAVDDSSILLKVSFDVVRTAGIWEVYFGSTGYDNAASTTGNQTATGSMVYYLRTADASADPELLRITANLDFEGTFDNVVVQEMPGTRATEAGVADTSGAQWDLYGSGIIGADTVVGGTFDSWSGDDPDGWTLSESGISTVTQSPTGKCRLLSPAGDLVQIAQAPGLLTLGQEYEASMTISNYVSGNPSLFHDGSSILTMTANGTGTVRFVATGSNIYIKRGGGVCDVSVDNVTCLKVTNSLTSLLEETLGDDLVTNGDFAADSDWSKGTGWTIAAGVASHTGSSATLSQDVGTLTVGNLYKLSFEITARTGGTFSLSSGSGAFQGGQIIAQSSAAVHTFYVTCTNDDILSFWGSSFEGSVDNISLTEVLNDSRGTLVVDWTPGAPASIATNNEGIVTSSENSTATLVYNDAAGTRIRTYDGANSPQLSLDWDANVPVRLAARWGINTDNVRMLQMSKTVAGTITNATAYEYDGAYVVGTILLFGRDLTWPQEIKNLKFYDRPLTDAEIEKL